MATVIHGDGHPIVLFRGNPTSSFLWRTAIPHVELDSVAGIAYLEANVAPRSWSQLSPEGRRLLELLPTPEREQMALIDNMFIETGLSGGGIRNLTNEKMAEYPFRGAIARKPECTHRGTEGVGG